MGKGQVWALMVRQGLRRPQAACSVLSRIVTSVLLCSFHLLRRGRGAVLGSTEMPVKARTEGPGGQGHNLCTLPSHPGLGESCFYVSPASSLAWHGRAPSPLRLPILRPCAEAVGAAAGVVGPRHWPSRAHHGREVAAFNFHAAYGSSKNI